MTIEPLPAPYPGYVHPPAYPGPTAPSAPNLARPRSPISPLSVALALASPAVTVTALVLCRHWSEHGARHSIGDMWPLGFGIVIGLAGSCYASATEDPELVGTCLALTGACLAVGTMAYPTGLAEPLITCGLATVTGWILARRHVRKRRAIHELYAENAAERTHQQILAAAAGQTAVGVATIKATAKVEAARIAALGELAVANVNADAASLHAWQLETADRRAAAMALSETARTALDAAAAPGAGDDWCEVAEASGILRRSA